VTLLYSPSELFSLTDKVAVVTGSASGIGKATAILFAAAGAKLILADKDLDGITALARELGPDAHAVEFDLRSDPSIEELFAVTERQFGTCDILINNAGIYPKYAFDDLTEVQWQEMQKVNVWGCFTAMRSAARLMRKSGNGGRIINVSSIGGLRTAVHNQIAYNASKAAIDSMTKSAALELAADAILVNSVCPGAVIPLEPKSKESGHVPPTGPLMDAGRILIGPAARPHEVAGPLLMLSSAAGGNITGQCIVIDGGFSVS
jgi:NAD(P)-dependent dehydrogenase (short-subunit alcohol dehydrogenase family)